MIAGVGPFDDVRDANELLLAHLAREAPPLSSLVLGVSPELERILATMLAKDCRQRPAHAREAADRLRSFALRQRSAPATDVPTAQAGYGAQTVDILQRRPLVSNPIHESITRPEGAARKQLADTDLSDDALTQRISLSPETTQVTLSASTGEAFSVSSIPNTTFVSPPSFDGTTTLQMSTVATHTPSSVPAPSYPPVERPERTEMLGEFPLPVPLQPADTRTHVPLPERARPVSITPPPVVDTGRAEGSESPRTHRAARWGRLVAAGLGLVVVTGYVLRRAALPSESGVAAVAAAPSEAKPLAHDAPALPKGAESGLLPAATATAPTVEATPAPSRVGPSPSAAQVSAPVTSASAQNSGMILDSKRLNGATLSGRTLTRADSNGVFLRKMAHAPVPRPSAPAMPASGL